MATAPEPGHCGACVHFLGNAESPRQQAVLAQLPWSRPMRYHQAKRPQCTEQAKQGWGRIWEHLESRVPTCG